MANNAIQYDRNKPFGQLTAEMIDHVVKARELALRINEKLTHLGALDGGGAAAVLEGHPLFGVEAGKGAGFVTAIGYLHDGLRGNVALAQDQVAIIDLGG